jgi:hypothetical protein
MRDFDDQLHPADVMCLACQIAFGVGRRVLVSLGAKTFRESVLYQTLLLQEQAKPALGC